MRNTRQAVKGMAFVLCVVGLCALVWVRSRDIGADRSGLGRSFDFDIDRYMEVDPALMLYDEADSIPLGLDAVTALAMGPDDRIYVGGDRVVLVLDPDGREVSRVAVDALPRCLAVDENNTLYVGIGDHVEVFDGEGLQTAVWDSFSADDLPVSIALRGEDVFVGEARRAQVLRYDRAGRLVDRIEGLILFSTPSVGIAVDPQQKLWVANPGGRELRRYLDDGTIDVAWRRSGRTIDSFSGCCNPVDIAIRSDGAIVTSEKNIVRVKVMSPTGELIGVVAGPKSFDPGITHLDVAMDSSGRILVLDPAKKAVRVFTEKG